MSYVGRGRVLGMAGVATWTGGEFQRPPEPDILMVSGKLDGMVGGSSAPQGSGYRG